MDLVLRYSAWDAIAVLGSYIVLSRARFPDFGIVGSYLLGAFFTAKAVSIGLNPVMSIFCGLFAGVFVGGMTMIFYYKCGVHSLLSGLCSLFISYSVCFLLFKDGSYKPGTIENSGPGIFLFLGMFFFLAILLAWLDSTFLGLKLKAVGMGEKFSEFLRFPERLMVSSILIVGNVLIALGASLRFQVEPTVNQNMIAGEFEFLVISMVLGLVIYDVLYGIFLNRFPRIIRQFRNTFFSKTIEFFMPLIGTIIYYSVIEISIDNFHADSNLKGIIALSLVTLFLVAKKTGTVDLSGLKFRGL